MMKNVPRGQLVGIWCMSVMTIGAGSIVLGAALTMLNAEMLIATCIVPPLLALLLWRPPPAALAAVTVALALLVAATPTYAQSASGYRDYQLGADVASTSALAGAAAEEAKTIQSRPAVIQELRWQRPYSTKDDAAQQITFTFYNDQLSRIVVDYDHDRTAGMTDADLIEALSAPYGPQLKSTVKNRPMAVSQVELESGTVLARWGDAECSVVLYRSSEYGSGFRIIVTSPRLEALARTSIAKASQLDEREAPRREIERQKKDADDARAAQAKARLTNKAAFRP
jgi:hypothetical protein